MWCCCGDRSDGDVEMSIVKATKKLIEKGKIETSNLMMPSLDLLSQRVTHPPLQDEVPDFRICMILNDPARNRYT